MCWNKKNIKGSGESSLMQLKMRKYDLYFESKKGNTISMDRFKKLQPIASHPSTRQ